MISFSKPQFAARPARSDVQFGNQPSPEGQQAREYVGELLTLLETDDHVRGGVQTAVWVNEQRQTALKLFCDHRHIENKIAAIIASPHGAARNQHAKDPRGNDVTVRATYKEVPVYFERSD